MPARGRDCSARSGARAGKSCAADFIVHPRRSRVRPCRRAPPRRGTPRTGCGLSDKSFPRYSTGTPGRPPSSTSAPVASTCAHFSSTRRVEISGVLDAEGPAEAAAGARLRASRRASARRRMRADHAAGRGSPSRAGPSRSRGRSRALRTGRRPRVRRARRSGSSRAHGCDRRATARRACQSAPVGKQPGIVLPQHARAGPGRRDDVVEGFERLDGAFRDGPCIAGVAAVVGRLPATRLGGGHVDGAPPRPRAA